MANNQPQDLLDILFENRNRAYGAYVLRRSFEKHMRNALIGGIFLILFLFMVPYLLTAISSALEKPKVDVIAELGPPPDIDPNTPPPPPPPKVETPPPPVKAQIRFVPPIVKKDEEVIEEKEIINVEDIKDEQISKEDVKGTGDQNVVVENEAPSDLGTTTEVVKDDKPEEPLTFVEAMPQFPGGEKELLTYFAQNIKYPAIARESGIQGRVILEFVVEKSGQVTNIAIRRDIGGGCGKEAVRVAQEMPAWKAGNQNGNSVRVKMNIPVVFKLE